MLEIVRSHYTGAWPNVQRVPLATKDLWFEEFQKYFYWDVSNYEMRKVFLHQAASHIRNVFKSCRVRGVRPSFITKSKWAEIELFRKTDPSMVNQASTNKRNRSTQNAIDAGNYRGGSRKVTKWMKVLEEKEGKRQTISDMVRMFWKKKDETWSGSKPATIVEKYESLALSQDYENESEEELWVKACDGPQNGRIFAMGEHGTALIRTKNFSTSRSHVQFSQSVQETLVQPFKEEIQELRATLLNLVKHQQEQQQQHADFQTLILQQFQKLQGNSASSSNTN